MRCCHISLTMKENVSETEDDVEEDPNYEASSSDENGTLSVDPPFVSQPPANTIPSKKGNAIMVQLTRAEERRVR